MKIYFYSLPTCPMCRTLKMQMEKEGLEFEYIEDIEKLTEVGVMAVPTIRIVFEHGAIETLLKPNLKDILDLVV